MTEPEQVLVTVADLRELRRLSTYDFEWYRNLIAAIPDPEWDPTKACRMLPCGCRAYPDPKPHPDRLCPYHDGYADGFQAGHREGLL